MSDARLRELERRWRETGAGDDEAAYLAERVRASDLPRDRLELAGYLGHAPARIALGEDAAAEVADLAACLRGLERWGRDAVVRALVAVARLALPSVSAEPAQERVDAMLAAAEAWLACPCEEHARAALELSRDASDLFPETSAQLLGQAIEGLLERVMTGGAGLAGLDALRRGALELVSRASPASPQEAAVLAVGLTCWITTWAEGISAQPDGFDAVARVVRSLEQLDHDEAALRAQVRAELVPWALARPE